MCKEKNKLFAEKRNFYWNNIIRNSQGNSKKLWSALNKVLCRDFVNNSSVGETNHSAQLFANFVHDKVEKVKETTEGAGDPSFCFVEFDVDKRFSSFFKCSQLDVRSVVMNSPTKTCILDVIPTGVFKNYVDIFLPYLTDLINSCFSTGCFPVGCKRAVVTPILKKQFLDINDLKNYRPVSNLPFVSKLIERIVVKQLLKHLVSNNLMPCHQSGYRQFHSTETLLLQIMSDLFNASDIKHASLLALLDMSSAFDCVVHSTLLRRLTESYGISGVVEIWFRSYFNNRTQQILYRDKYSEIENVLTGVPQGSVLGPVLFLLYTADVFKIIENFNFKGYAFADDMQIVSSAPVVLFDDMASRLIDCLVSVDNWMAQNGLRMNQCKTQMLPVGTWQQTSKIGFSSIKIHDLNIEFCSSATNLGFTFDTNMYFHDHVRSLVSSCAFQLRQLRSVKAVEQKHIVYSGSLLCSFTLGLLQ